MDIENVSCLKHSVCSSDFPEKRYYFSVQNILLVSSFQRKTNLSIVQKSGRKWMLINQLECHMRMSGSFSLSID